MWCCVSATVRLVVIVVRLVGVQEARGARNLFDQHGQYAMGELVTPSAMLSA